MLDKVIHKLKMPVDKSIDTPDVLRELSTPLTGALRFASSFRAASAVRSGRTSKLLGALFALAATVTIWVQPVAADTVSSDHLKLYLHSKIINYKHFTCAVEVAHRESRWNWQARNGNHFGLFQMNNKKVQRMNPYTQIDWWLRYVHTRYAGDPCKSLSHLKKFRWQ